MYPQPPRRAGANGSPRRIAHPERRRCTRRPPVFAPPPPPPPLPPAARPSPPRPRGPDLSCAALALETRGPVPQVPSSDVDLLAVVCRYTEDVLSFDGVPNCLKNENSMKPDFTIVELRSRATAASRGVGRGGGGAVTGRAADARGSAVIRGRGIAESDRVSEFGGGSGCGLEVQNPPSLA